MAIPGTVRDGGDISSRNTSSGTDNSSRRVYPPQSWKTPRSLPCRIEEGFIVGSLCSLGNPPRSRPCQIKEGFTVDSFPKHLFGHVLNLKVKYSWGYY